MPAFFSPKRFNYSSRFGACLFLTIIVSAVCWVLISISVPDNSSHELTSADHWRYVNDQWVDVRQWHALENTSAPAPLEMFHPVYWAALELLAVLAAVIWSSNEVDIHRIVGGDSLNRNIVGGNREAFA